MSDIQIRTTAVSEGPKNGNSNSGATANKARCAAKAYFERNFCT